MDEAKGYYHYQLDLAEPNKRQHLILTHSGYYIGNQQRTLAVPIALTC